MADRKIGNAVSPLVSTEGNAGLVSAGGTPIKHRLGPLGGSVAMGRAVFSAVASFVATGFGIFGAAAAFRAVASFVASGNRITFGLATFDAEASFSASGTTVRPGTATFDAVASFVAVGVNPNTGGDWDENFWWW